MCECYNIAMRILMAAASTATACQLNIVSVLCATGIWVSSTHIEGIY